MTESHQKLLQRSSNFLRRMLSKPAWEFKRFVVDRRGRRGRRWQFETLMKSLLYGYLSNRGSLRAVEQLTALAFRGRVADTTLYDLVSSFTSAEVAGLRRQLHAQMRSEWRSKALAPVGLPCGMAAVDNKTVWTGPVAAAHDPCAQVVHRKDRAAYAQVRVVRTVLISAAVKPCIDQVVIEAETNECGKFPEVLAVLQREYNSLIEVYSLDAGFCSEANARLINEAEKGYIFGLKGNQPELLRETQRLLDPLSQPEWSSAWEKYQGQRIRYHLYRTTELEGYLAWSHLKQAWRIEKELVNGKSGVVTREQHYYLTNLHRGRLKPEQIVYAVRSHWAIENNCNWTMDVIWDEDTKVWCGQGVGIQVLGLLRVMAYNLMSHLRCRYLRKRAAGAAQKRSWKELLDLSFLLFTSAGLGLLSAKEMKFG